MIQSNRHLHKNVVKIGQPFTYGLTLNFLSDSPLDNGKTPTNVPIPLFGANMFETFYNELTNNLSSATPTTNGYVGVSNYGASIWDAMAQFNLGGVNHTAYYPYGGPDFSGGSAFFSNDFFMKISSGSILNATDTVLAGWMRIRASKMAYLNMMRTLQTKKVLCTNMNFQWKDIKFQDNDLRRNPLYFYDQKIDGTVMVTETTIGRYLDPVKNVATRSERFNIDVPCDWIFGCSSGVTIGWDALRYYYVDENNPQDFNITFTFQEVEG